MRRLRFGIATLIDIPDMMKKDVEGLVKMRRAKTVVIGILLCWVSVVCCLYFGIACSEQSSWDCPECGRMGNTKNYCGGCGHPRPEKVTEELSGDVFKIVGSIVKFGHYEQDNNLDNGQEEIEWIVLDVQEGKSLLISKYGLEMKPYNTENKAVTWETCTLRKWLNNDFLKTAFMTKEKSAILKTKVDNSKSQGYSEYNTTGGKDTQDQIFLLSYHEAHDLYFKNDGERTCVQTQYAVAQGAYRWWWLRSPGSTLWHAALVSSVGTRDDYFVSTRNVCVRPAFWINLEVDIF